MHFPTHSDLDSDPFNHRSAHQDHQISRCCSIQWTLRSLKTQQASTQLSKSLPPKTHFSRGLLPLRPPSQVSLDLFFPTIKLKSSAFLSVTLLFLQVILYSWPLNNTRLNCAVNLHMGFFNSKYHSTTQSAVTEYEGTKEPCITYEVANQESHSNFPLCGGSALLIPVLSKSQWYITHQLQACNLGLGLSFRPDTYAQTVTWVSLYECGNTLRKTELDCYYWLG